MSTRRPTSPRTGTTHLISGVTLTTATASAGWVRRRGGVRRSSTSLTLADSAVAGSSAPTSAAALYTEGDAGAVTRRSPATGRTAAPRPATAAGSTWRAATTESAPDRHVHDQRQQRDGAGGGLYASNGVVTLTQSTIAGNVGAPGAGIFKELVPPGSTTRSSPLGRRGLFRAAVASQAADNLADRRQLRSSRPSTLCSAPLTNNGGPTDTHALSASSPAIDAASGGDLP